MNYWCFRIDKSKFNYLFTELEAGRLRQGWGWDPNQDLRNLTMDEGAGRNKRMFEEVKKGDILLVPHLPSPGLVALVEATEDWDKGYNFSIDKKVGDYGHVFPARFLKSFVRDGKHISSKIRGTLKNPSRFWSIWHLEEEVNQIIGASSEELQSSEDKTTRFQVGIEKAFNESLDIAKFSDEVYNNLTSKFNSAEWESALIDGLKILFPAYQIEHVGGKSERNHGTDILIRIPGLLDYDYAIAIQVKDYQGFVGSQVVNQLNKADKYWTLKTGTKLIEKIVIITRATKEDNLGLIERDENTKFIFAEDLKKILTTIAKQYVRQNNFWD